MITTLTPEMSTRHKRGVTYWTVLGLEDPINQKTETLDECIKRIFKVDNFDTTREKRIVFARHMKRYILERLDKKGQITDRVRTRGNRKDYSFLYTADQIAEMCDCDRTTLSHSWKTARNLMETDKDLRAKADKILRKIELNLIIF